MLTNVDANARLVNALERLVYGSVGITTLAIAQTSEAAELTFAQWRVLVMLGDGPRRVGEIAGRLAISITSASRLVRRMENKGYVDTARDERDRRATLVTLSDKGARTRAGVTLHRRALIDNLVRDGASALPGDLNAGLEVLAERFLRYV